ncbi:polymorphic toxin-type HINT domain-containing protein [Aquihabitans sp. McL0605]|uniref:polymorphic toxin-type HINT domain-containing protein n=1 Tax=Aquihabitans sp. McL0605 TaxID=3415671 RepID=UPI003CE75788
MTDAYNVDRQLTTIGLPASGQRIDFVWDDTTAVPVAMDAYVGSSLWTRSNYGLQYLGYQASSGANAVFFAFDAHRDVVNSSDYTAPTTYNPSGAVDGTVPSGVTFGYRDQIQAGALLHLDNRDYDAATASFTTPDPLGGDDGTTTVANPYHYGGNDPLNQIDPSGLHPIDDSALGPRINAACLERGGWQNTRSFSKGYLKAFGLGSVPKLIDPDDPVCDNSWETAGTATGAGLQIATGAEGIEGLADPAESTIAPEIAGDGSVIGDGDAIEPSLGDSGSATEEPAGSGAGEGDSQCSAGAGNSFTTDTPVLMADGTYRAIGGVHVGDQVWATDPATGRSHARAVTATMAHDDDDLLDLSITGPGGHEGVLHTTEHHKIWDTTRNAWSQATDLTRDDHLRQPDGSSASVVGITHRPGGQRMFDLTIQTDHTFYVQAADETGYAAVLVHNCPEDEDGGGGAGITQKTVRAGDLAGYTESQATRGPWSIYEHMSDDELIDSINNAPDGDGINVSRDGAVYDGHHRWDELMLRVSDGRISADTSIRIWIVGGE